MLNSIKQANINFFEYGLGIVLFSLVLKPSYNSIAIILFLMLSLLTFIKDKIRPKLKKDDLIGALLLSLPFIYLFTSSFFPGILMEKKFVIRNLPLIVFPFLFLLLKGNVVISRNKVLAVLVRMLFVYNISIFTVAMARQISKYPDFSKINWYFFSYRGLLKYFDVHATYLGLLNNLAILFLLFLVQKQKPGERIFSYAMMISSLLITVLSGSRIQIVVTITLLLLFLFSKLSRKRLFVFLGIVLFSGLFLTYVPIVRERVIDTVFNPTKTFRYAKYGNNPGEKASLKKRLQMNMCGVNMINKKIWLGYGSAYEKEPELLKCYEEKGLLKAYENQFNVHNQYVGLLLTGGTVFFLTFMLVFFLSLFKSVSSSDFMYIGFLFIVSITGFTENILERHFGIIYFSLLNSFFYFYRYGDEKLWSKIRTNRTYNLNKDF
ncbi:O-antigen ligase family protein [Muricauda sp. NFXS6]|uniref:O-antigen ligase family protein n=1 Tax=Allomuricauda sp. NFXS6 TaxID=2819094 RepID=UPI0032DF357C